MAFLAFVTTPYENAKAVDIPPNTSYEEGTKLLHDAVQNEAFETHATAIMVKDKDGNIKAIRWISKEAEERRVVRNKDKWMSEIVKSTQALGLGKGDALSIGEFHTHPVKAADKEEADKKIFRQVMPPSPGSDINFFKHAKIKHALKTGLHAKLTVTSAVVDFYGVWRIEYDDNAPAMKLANTIAVITAFIESKKDAIRDNLAQMSTEDLISLLKRIYSSSEPAKEYEFINEVLKTIPNIIALLQSPHKSEKELVQLSADTAILLLKAMAISDKEILNELLKGTGMDTEIIIKLSQYMKRFDASFAPANKVLLAMFSAIRDAGSNLDKEGIKQFASGKYIHDFINSYRQMGVKVRYDLFD